MEQQVADIVRSCILKESETFEVSPELVAAIIYQESYRAVRKLSIAIFAIRYEDGFYARYIANKTLVGENPNFTQVSRVTEMRARAISWGLMQIMGQTAREMGYGEPYLSALVNPEVNIHYGTKYLASRLRRFGAIDGVRAYNGSIKNPDTEKYRIEVEGHISSGAYKEILGDD